jgi:ribosomal protein S6--L-glutamate ligase
MTRGRFPYGHLDLMVAEDGSIFLAEINLHGGIRGASISTAEYKSRVKMIEKTLLAQFQ